VLNKSVNKIVWEVVWWKRKLLLILLFSLIFKIRDDKVMVTNWHIQNGVMVSTL